MSKRNYNNYHIKICPYGLRDSETLLNIKKKHMMLGWMFFTITGNAIRNWLIMDIPTKVWIAAKILLILSLAVKMNFFKGGFKTGNLDLHLCDFLCHRYVTKKWDGSIWILRNRDMYVQETTKWVLLLHLNISQNPSWFPAIKFL